MRGRKLIPMHLKLIRGNPGKRAVLREPEPAVGEANPPDFLLGYAADEWFRVVDELLRLKLVTIIDLNVLAAYCQAYSGRRTMEEKLAEMAQRDTATAALLIRGPDGAVCNHS
jgi:phage terminase small subunit